MKILVDTRETGAVPGEFLVLWCFSDERPLKGLTGLLDWRLDTAVSRLLMSGTISGTWGEKVLMCGFDAALPEGFLLIGLGPMAEFGEKRMRDAGRLMARSIVKLKKRSASMALPGNGISRFDTSAVAEHFLFGLIQEAKDADFTPTFLCGLNDVDEALLGFQKTKVSLKSHVLTDIVQVKS